ncbi:MAG: CarD family transcriptional regulator [Polyangiales bacterium]
MESSFQVGDKAVHPAHGLGEVTAIENRMAGGNDALYYVLKILESGMRVMVPTRAADAVGLRGVMSPEEAERVLEVFSTREKPVGTGPWNRRLRAYTELLKSGSPVEVARVLRDLYAVKLRHEKELSYGERRLMDQARALLLKELALATGSDEKSVERAIESRCAMALAA